MVNRKLELSRAERHVHNFMMDTQLTKRVGTQHAFAKMHACLQHTPYTAFNKHNLAISIITHFKITTFSQINIFCTSTYIILVVYIVCTNRLLYYIALQNCKLKYELI